VLFSSLFDSCGVLRLLSQRNNVDCSDIYSSSSSSSSDSSSSSSSSIVVVVVVVIIFVVKL